MADQWGRKIWEEIKDLTQIPAMGTDLNAALGNIDGIIPKVAAGYARQLRTDSPHYPSVVSVSHDGYVGQQYSSLFRPRFRFTDDDDSSNGIGARIVLFKGLDTNFMPATYRSSTTGVTPKTLSVDWIRIISVQVIECGSLRANKGELQCWRDGGSDVDRLITMAPGDNYGSVAAFTSPMDTYVFLKHITVRANYDSDGCTAVVENTEIHFQMQLRAKKIAIGSLGIYNKIFAFSVGLNSLQNFDINLMFSDLVDISVVIDGFGGKTGGVNRNEIPPNIISCELHYYEINISIHDEIPQNNVVEVF